MVREAFGEEDEEADPGLDVKTMFLMAVATSIDALVVGVTFAFVPIEIVNASVTVNTFIGCTIIGVMYMCTFMSWS